MCSPRSRKRARFVCCLLFVQLSTAARKDDDLEVLTLGAVQPPLLTQVHSPSSRYGGRPKPTAVPLEGEESPDQTIARLLRDMFARESHQLQGEGAGLTADTPLASTTAISSRASAKTLSTALADQTRAISEEENVRQTLAGSSDAAEVGEPHDHEPGEVSSSDVGPPHREGLDSTDTEINHGGERVAAEAAGVLENLGLGTDEGSEGSVTEEPHVRHVRGVEGGSEEMGGGASAAAGEPIIGASAAVGEPMDGPAEPLRDEFIDPPVEAYARLVDDNEGNPGTRQEGETRAAGAEASLGKVSEAAGPGAGTLSGHVEDEDASQGRAADAAGEGTAEDSDEAVHPEARSTAGAEEREDGTTTNDRVGKASLDEDGSVMEQEIGLGEEVGEVKAVEIESDRGADVIASSGATRGKIAGADGRDAAEEAEVEDAALAPHYNDAPGTIATATFAAAAATAEAAAAAERISISAAILAGAESPAGEHGAAGLIRGYQAPLRLHGGVGGGTGSEADAFPTQEDEAGDDVTLLAAPVEGIPGADFVAAGERDEVPVVSLSPPPTAVESSGNKDQDQESTESGSGATVLGSPTDTASPGKVAGGPGGASGTAAVARPDAGADAGAADADAGAGADADVAHTTDDEDVQRSGGVGVGGELAAGAAAPAESSGEAGEEDGTPRQLQNDDTKPPGAAANDPGTAAPNTRVGERELVGGRGSTAGASGEDFPRNRPRLRFAEPLPHGTGDDRGFALPPLPPIGSMPRPGAAEGADALVAEQAVARESGGGWWDAWGKESAEAMRDKVAYWWGRAAKQGGMLMKEMLEVCKSRAVQSWHEMIEPRAENLRQRLEQVAIYCTAEVAEHLEDPILAGAL